MGIYSELLAYKKAYALALKIHELSKKFPSEEKYSLTDQIRRSSRSVCANIAESYRRRRYKDYFISKLNDAETENAETEVWLNFTKDFNFISLVEFEELVSENMEVGKLLYTMINHPDKFR
jgi:four helix bundle protein